MKKFISSLIFFLMPPVFLVILVELLLPPDLFTFRPVEALKFVTKIQHIGPFYPDMNLKMNDAVGDFCHHTIYAIHRKEYWITDELGFRNDEFIRSPDILIVGTSFIYGSGLSQEETISNLLQSKLNNKYTVYNITGTMGDIDEYFKKGIINKPKLLIYSNVERNLPDTFRPFEKTTTSKIKKIIKSIFLVGVNTVLDRLARFYSIKWMKARINNVKGFGIQSPVDPKMFFLEGTSIKEIPDTELNNSIQAIKSYKAYCDSLHISFLYMPMPNKETVYYDLVPLPKQPNYLFKLDSALKLSNINTINTLKIYNKYREAEPSVLLYYADDSHWNPKAVNIITSEITTRITSGEIYIKP